MKIYVKSAEEDPAKVTIEDRYKELVDTTNDDYDYLMDTVDKLFRDGNADEAIQIVQRIQTGIGSIIADATSSVSDTVEVEWSLGDNYENNEKN